MLSILDPDPCPACPAPFNLAGHVLTQAGARPDHIALQIVRANGAERWRYGRLAAAVRGVATGFLNAGLAPGDRVMLRLGKVSTRLPSMKPSKAYQRKESGVGVQSSCS